jgi:hypothetical protein
MDGSLFAPDAHKTNAEKDFRSLSQAAVLNEWSFRHLCRKANWAARKDQRIEPLAELRRLLCQRVGLPEPADNLGVPAEIARMNQILTIVEMRMGPPFPVRGVILEEIFKIAGPNKKVVLVTGGGASAGNVEACVLGSVFVARSSRRGSR